MENKRNRFMLNGKKAKNGYDWWWHDISAINDSTGEVERFFIEYYVINPKISPEKILYGQKDCTKPSYAKIIAGKWGKNKAQIHNYFKSSEFWSATKEFDVKIGKNIANEKKLKGLVFQSQKNVFENPHLMSDAGEMSWDLEIVEKIPYSVGYGASAVFRKLNLFQMYWHVQGLRTKYSGKIIYNGQSFTCTPQYIGYQDKNWGSDYTNPWIWLNCNNFKDQNNNSVENISFDVGGGKPIVLGIPLKGKILVAFYENGKIHDFNFTKLFFQKQKWNCRIDDGYVYWEVCVENRKNILQLNFKCKKESMLKINYENPKGEKNHNNLYNGGYAEGYLKFFKKNRKENILIYNLVGELAGCEYGEY